MRGILERLRRGKDAPSRPSAPRRAVDVVATARALADALDRAVTLGLARHAERIAAAAARLARHHARLTDRLARLRLAQGDPETAVALIDACQQSSASLRLLRAACLLRLGRTIEAHADLHRWSLRPSAPLPARLLLALLEWSGGDRGAAIEALRRNLRQMEDPRTLVLLVLLHAEDERDEWVDVWAERLRAAAAWTEVDPDPDLLLFSLGQPRTHERIQPTPEQVETLATELIAAEVVIPSLVQAQVLEPDDAVVELLDRAIEIALPDLGRPAAAMEQLARLALLRGDLAGARRWAERALEANPMSAALALLVHELREPAPDVLPTATSRAEILARIGRAATRTDAGKEKAA